MSLFRLESHTAVVACRAPQWQLSRDPRNELIVKNCSVFARNSSDVLVKLPNAESILPSSLFAALSMSLSSILPRPLSFRPLSPRTFRTLHSPPSRLKFSNYSVPFERGRVVAVHSSAVFCRRLQCRTVLAPPRHNSSPASISPLSPSYRVFILSTSSSTSPTFCLRRLHV